MEKMKIAATASSSQEFFAHFTDAESVAITPNLR
jgi:hypothetical protein